MAKNAGNRVKLGLFVTAAVVLLMTTVYLIGQRQRLFGESVMISAEFGDVSGLMAGNNVRFSGVNVGIVESVSITRARGVRVEMLISKEAQKFIKQDAEATIGSESMMGNKVVVLTAGSDEADAVENHAELRAIEPINMDDLVRDFKRTAENAHVVSGNLARLTNMISSGKGPMGRMFMSDELSDDVATTISNLKDSSQDFKNLVADAQNSWLLWGFGKKSREDQEKERQQAGEADAAGESPKNGSAAKTTAPEYSPGDPRQSPPARPRP